MAFVVVALLAGCQLAGGPGDAVTEPPTDAAGRPIGAPPVGMPQTLAELLERGQLLAEEWQDEPVVVEVEVDIDDGGSWSGARLTYLAADADRFLSLVTSGSGFSQQRPSLATFQLQPVTPDGVEQIPQLPEDAAEPAELAASEAAAGCGVEGAATVLYVTGAPVAWDGTSWSAEPSWRANVTDEDAPGAALDVTTGEGDCLS